ncbi:hypothetical protein QX201_000049 [Fusarium graminearum]
MKRTLRPQSKLVGLAVEASSQVVLPNFTPSQDPLTRCDSGRALEYRYIDADCGEIPRSRGENPAANLVRFTLTSNYSFNSDFSSAILTKYEALRSFMALKPEKLLPIMYENAAIYTNALLDAYMDYKNVSQIS